MPPTNSFRRSRLIDRGTGITRHGIKRLILISRGFNGNGRSRDHKQVSRRRFAAVSNADGVMSVFPTMVVEYRFCNADNGAAWSAWMIEHAIFWSLTRMSAGYLGRQ